MTSKIADKDLKNISSVILKRYKANCFREMPAKARAGLIKNLKKSYEEDRLIFDYLPSGKLAYFFHFNRAYMGEFAEHFCYFSHLYSVEDKKVRARFYRAIKASAKKMQLTSEKDKKVKRMACSVDVNDETSKKYFAKNGQLTYVLLIGKTSEALKYLKDVKSAPFKNCRLKKSDINQCIKLDIESHIKDKTSRMNGPFRSPNAKKLSKDFYKALLKNKSCFVLKDKKKIAGSTGFFIDPNEKLGLVGGIFVTHAYKGRGVSKILYKNLLEEFQKRKLRYYLGATTTAGVLGLAEKLKRTEVSRSYILKI